MYHVSNLVAASGILASTGRTCKKNLQRYLENLATLNPINCNTIQGNLQHKTLPVVTFLEHT